MGRGAGGRAPDEMTAGVGDREFDGPGAVGGGGLIRAGAKERGRNKSLN